MPQTLIGLNSRSKAQPFAPGLGEQAPGIPRRNKTPRHSARWGGLADDADVAVSVWVTLLQRPARVVGRETLLLAARKGKRSSPCAQAMRRDPSPHVG